MSAPEDIPSPENLPDAAADLRRVIPGDVDPLRDIAAENTHFLAGVTGWFDGALLDPERSGFVGYADADDNNRARIATGWWFGQPTREAKAGDYGFAMGDIVRNGIHWCYVRVGSNIQNDTWDRVIVEGRAWDPHEINFNQLLANPHGSRRSWANSRLLDCIETVRFDAPAHPETLQKVLWQLLGIEKPYDAQS